ncbi:Hypothetical predicted protein [Cloeon dipterum]|nr:Hypothetical predicted protein [Cloeon dipterum]
MRSFCILLLAAFALAEATIMYPGTNYCGPGSFAPGEAKLKDVDDCCKLHDGCPIKIERGVEKYNLFNDGLFTRSSCECDEKLRDCLKRVGSWHSKVIRKTYDFFGPRKCIEIKTTCIERTISG